MKTLLCAALVAAMPVCALGDEPLEFTILRDYGVGQSSVVTTYGSNGTELASVTLTGLQPGGIASAEFSPDGAYWTHSTFLTNEFGTVDLTTGQFNAVGDLATLLPPAPNFGGQGGIAFSHSGEIVHVRSGNLLDQVNGGFFNEIYSFTLDGQLVSTLRVDDSTAIGSGLTALSNGNFLALSAFDDGRIIEIDGVTGVETLRTQTTVDNLVDFARLGGRYFLLTGGGDVYEYELSTGDTSLIIADLNGPTIGDTVNFGLSVRLVPAPASLALLASMGLVAARRKR